jgi:hypothetical protein
METFQQETGQKIRLGVAKLLNLVARLEGFEPPTLGSEVRFQALLARISAFQNSLPSPSMLFHASMETTNMMMASLFRCAGKCL